MILLLCGKLGLLLLIDLIVYNSEIRKGWKYVIIFCINCYLFELMWVFEGDSIYVVEWDKEKK